MNRPLKKWLLPGLTATVGAVAFATVLLVVDLMSQAAPVAGISRRAISEAESLRSIERELLAGLEPFEYRRPPENDTRAIGFQRNARTTLRARANQTRRQLVQSQLHDSLLPLMLLAADRLVALSKDPYNDEALRRARDAVRMANEAAEERIQDLGATDYVKSPRPTVRRF
jgi:hypothetical protein